MAKHVGACAFVAPVVLGLGSGLAVAGDVVQLTGVMRDFRSTHPDFSVSADDAGFTIAGLVEQRLGADGLPVFTDTGTEIASAAASGSGYSIAGHLVADAGTAVTDFTITDGVVKPSERFSVNMRVLGAAIETGSYAVPVTARFSVGGQTAEPFGAFASPTQGDLNDDQSGTRSSEPSPNPQSYTFAGTFGAGTAINIDARSWLKRSSNSAGSNDAQWYVAHQYSTSTDSDQVRVLRNGDAVPNVAAMYDQAAIASYVSAYTDSATNTMVLEDNQVIYLFELGGSGTSSYADFQDLVVLVTLATDESYFEASAPKTDACGNTMNDTAPTFGETSDAGIGSAASFRQWFSSSPVINLSKGYGLPLTRGGDGVYTYETADFRPIDGQMLSPTPGEVNRDFTFHGSAAFTYEACMGQFIEVSGDLDAWVFVDGELLIDLGGADTDAVQRGELDRLGLSDGQAYTMKVFLAQRGGQAEFAFRTNVDLEGASRSTRWRAAYQGD